ncbi:hypothetical protein NDU88_000471 [Pleurodeles waltl]|uniref:Uncharacterized protein n=1 Tax=Pleurodeles waltl TaxID=8319 RepID=A0AAV7UQ26_PLEWA|nr:hypothetical protein NDU88_000471 [Pleurodeles waltl]
MCLSTWADSLGLCDAWRSWHQQMRAFTHQFAAHHTEVRIDPLPAVDLLALTSVQILTISISDPVLLSWGAPVSGFGGDSLGGQQTLLEGRHQGVGQAAESPAISVDNRAGGRDGGPGALSPQSDGEKPGRQLALLCAELQKVSNAEARQCWQASIQRVYQLGDKTRNLLYWLATRDVSARVVPLIQDQIGSIQEELQAIAHTFSSYYKDPYAQVPQPMDELENPILGDIPLPTIPTSLAKGLDLPLTEEEVEDTISGLQSGRTPCLDW